MEGAADKRKGRKEGRKEGRMEGRKEGRKEGRSLNRRRQTMKARESCGKGWRTRLRARDLESSMELVSCGA